MSEDDATYTKNTKEQYEALGRFVEAFEAMVNQVREISIELLSKDRRQRDLVEIPFHHQAMTAKPLFEILRALIIEIVNESIKRQEREEQKVTDLDPAPVVDYEGHPLVFNVKNRETFSGVLANIASEYETLTNMRNNLLHATWFVGYVSSDDQLASEFYARKYTVGKKGISRLELPKKAPELLKLTDRCDLTRIWIWRVHGCLTGPDDIHVRFVNERGRWFLVTESGNKSTLPDSTPPESE
jgi:hypothetical protein